MTKDQARAYVWRVLAAEVRHHLSNGSEWLERPLNSDGVAVRKDGSFSEADQQRILAAVQEVADLLERTSKVLGAKSTKA